VSLILPVMIHNFASVVDTSGNACIDGDVDIDETLLESLTVRQYF
jgi:hypothetical protein